MLKADEAIGRILDLVTPMEDEVAPLLTAQGRVLRAQQDARFALPPWDNSAMDGFAVRASELPATLPISGVLAAGASPNAELASGTCMKIMTGAPVPAGADTVVMRETVVEDGKVATFAEAPTLGRHIRQAGEDVSANSVLLPSGSLLGPGELAILAAQGISEVPVCKKPRVAILSTGDELVPLGTTPKDSQIISSNSITLAAQVREAGGIPVDAGIVPDTLVATVRALRSLTDYDMLLTSGGVSVGDFDYVKEAYESIGVSMDFWKVAIKPGKPLAFGTRRIPGKTRQQMVFGLPGNPASSLVSFEVFVRPALRKLQGFSSARSPRISVTLSEDIEKGKGRTNYLRAKLRDSETGPVATTLRKQGSGMLRSMVSVDCLLELDADTTHFAAGSQVAALPLRNVWQS
ncbi:MAG: molybdopterin molybdotransferase MoeA [Myxococcales bacterium]|nr:molybdopterin molybdotransferase MoeA [Myxococcales bacterium]